VVPGQLLGRCLVVGFPSRAGRASTGPMQRAIRIETLGDLVGRDYRLNASIETAFLAYGDGALGRSASGNPRSSGHGRVE